jgi:hypothetical protein
MNEPCLHSMQSKEGLHNGNFWCTDCKCEIVKMSGDYYPIYQEGSGLYWKARYERCKEQRDARLNPPAVNEVAKLLELPKEYFESHGLQGLSENVLKAILLLKGTK